jgi:hypothetical protein
MQKTVISIGIVALFATVILSSAGAFPTYFSMFVIFCATFVPFGSVKPKGTVMEINSQLKGYKYE